MPDGVGSIESSCSASEVDGLLARLVAQFESPYDFVREVVQNAMDAGSDRVEFVQDAVVLENLISKYLFSQAGSRDSTAEAPATTE